MREANIYERNKFKKIYCKSHTARLQMRNDFNIQIESYEELLPGNTVKSYATGNRDIDNGFVVFSVIDTDNDIVYHPVFSETVGRQLAKIWGMKLPSKMTVFANNDSGGDESKCYGREPKHVVRRDENHKMLALIQFARSMMILHIDDPEPMREPFKGIYRKLTDNPGYEVWVSDIKSINTAIRHYLAKPVNIRNENFLNLQEFIRYIQNKYPKKRLKNFDFRILRDKMKRKYPDESILF